MSPRLDLRLLGDFRAEVYGKPVPVDAWRRGRAATLVKLLSLAARRRLSRDEVIEALWPGVAPDAGGANVRKAVHFARRALGADDAIGVHGGTIELWPKGSISTDVEWFEAASTKAFAARDGDAFRLAADLYSGDLLPDDRSEPSFEERRRRLHETYVGVLRGAAMWTRLLEIDPTDEEAHRELMRSLLDSGNRQDRKSTRLNSSHSDRSRMPSSA